MALFNFVALLNADPGNAAGDLGIHVDLVMSDHVSSGGKHGGAGDVTAFGGSADNFHLRCIRGEQAIGERGQPEKNDQRNATEDDPAGPCRRLTAAIAQGVVDAQVL